MSHKWNKNPTLSFIVAPIILMLILAVSFENSAAARSEKSFVELTASNHSKTLNDVYSFGLYSSITGSSKLRTYAGVQFMEFEQATPGENSSAIKILIGQTFGQTFSPFYEVGTDVFGLFYLLDNNKETDTCSTDQQCAIDFYFRIGVRIKLNENLILGLFHENIDFGDFHASLSGEHRYVGSSFGFEF
ncbi:MAG: hypothetical protein OEY66_07380 [Gammaproteobacteria bacterium]|nr:hypothetical protein [Gammaproteobacteria bacterium]